MNADQILCLRSAYGLRAGSFGSPFGLAQDFASWRTPARRLNFGRVEGDSSTFVRGLTPRLKQMPPCGLGVRMSKEKRPQTSLKRKDC